MAAIDIVHVPYKGTALFLPDLIDGRVSMSLDSMPPHLPHIKSGKLRALAVTSAKRSPVLPELPTVAEAALPGFESIAPYALFAPAGTPADIIALLNREVNAVLVLPEVARNSPSRDRDIGQHRRCTRRHRQERNRQMGESHQGRQHQARIAQPRK